MGKNHSHSIIIAANYRRDTGLLEEEEAPSEDEDGDGNGANLWTITERPDGCHELTIPSSAKLASVIDGQHRLFSFAEALPKRLDMELICSVFLDLPKLACCRYGGHRDKLIQATPASRSKSIGLR